METSNVSSHSTAPEGSASRASGESAGNGNGHQGPYAGVPVELHERKQWVTYKLVPIPDKPGKMDKVPYNARTGKPAKSNDPTTWSTFEQAVARATRDGYHGIGYMFSADDPYVGVDLDSCRDKETGSVMAWAWEFIDALAGYTEVSPSGTGVHVIVRGSVPPGGHKRRYETGVIEMYDRGRFFTVTGVAL